MSSTPYDPERDGAQMSFDGRMSYSDYLSLDKILTAQTPRSEAHDEMLFIVQHQTSELWMRLALHELTAASELLRTGQMRPAFKMLARLSRIFEQLNSAWDVLRTMTPADYTTFRATLGQSSGFQSWQYRRIEFLLGNRNQAMLRPHEHRAETIAQLRADLNQPSLYDIALMALAGAGLALPEDVLTRDWAQPYVANPAVTDAWAQVYKNPDRYWEIYELGEKLVDLEDYFRRWRFNHLTTVERVIGLKRGTGGTSGTSYLKRMLDTVLFPELWMVRTEL